MIGGKAMATGKISAKQQEILDYILDCGGKYRFKKK